MIRVAWIVPGGVGNEDASGDIPILAKLLNGMTDKCDITVYSLSDTGFREKYVENRVLIRSAACNDWPLWRKTIWLLRCWYGDHRRSPFRLVHGFWAFPSGLLAVILGNVFGLPSAVSLLGGEGAYIPDIGYGNMLRKSIRWATRYTCRRGTVLAALTKFQLDQLSRFDILRKDAWIIPLGVDLETFKMHDRKEINRSVNLLHVGNLTEVKDQETLLRAMAMLVRVIDSRLRIIGPDFMNGKIHKCVDDLGLQDCVQFFGFVPNSNLWEHLEWADMMIHSSRYEGQAVVVAEAAASGVPVVGTRVGIIADYDEDCFLGTEVGNYSQLAEKVVWLLKNENERRRLTANARHWAATHDARWTSEEYKILYQKLTQRKFDD